MRRPHPLLLTACLAAALGLNACGKNAQDGAGSAKAAPGKAGAPAMPPAEVGVVTVQPHTVDVTESLPGRTTAYQVAEIRPQVSGIVLKRLFEEGSMVKTGQQLYQIDPATYQAAVDTAVANVNKAAATLTAAKNQAGRYAGLVKLNAISRQAYDDAIATQRSDEADLASAKAALQTAQINLAYTKVMSPITGRIGKSSVTPGALVTANQTATLATVTQLDPIYVDVTQSSAQLMQLKNKLAAGQITPDKGDAVVDLMLDDVHQQYPHPGKLQFADVTVDPTTGSVDIRAEFPNPEGMLLPGLFVRAVLHEGQHDNVLTVPQQAVSRDAQGQASVWVVGADNKAQKAIIQTGDAIGDQWLVTGGLQAGQTIVVQGIQKVQPGATVKPAPMTAPAGTANDHPSPPNPDHPQEAPGANSTGPDKAGDVGAPETGSPKSQQPLNTKAGQ